MTHLIPISLIQDLARIEVALGKAVVNRTKHSMNNLKGDDADEYDEETARIAALVQHIAKFNEDVATSY